METAAFFAQLTYSDMCIQGGRNSRLAVRDPVKLSRGKQNKRGGIVPWSECFRTVRHVSDLLFRLALVGTRYTSYSELYFALTITTAASSSAIAETPYYTAAI